jgi:hypothetical protein
MKEEQQATYKALIFIRFQEPKLKDVVAWCRSEPKVVQFSTLTGEYDGIIEVEYMEIEDLYQMYVRLDQLEGIQTINSHIVLQEFNS